MSKDSRIARGMNAREQTGSSHRKVEVVPTDFVDWATNTELYNQLISGKKSTAGLRHNFIKFLSTALKKENPALNLADDKLDLILKICLDECENPEDELQVLQILVSTQVIQINHLESSQILKSVIHPKLSSNFMKKPYVVRRLYFTSLILSDSPDSVIQFERSKKILPELVKLLTVPQEDPSELEDLLELWQCLISLGSTEDAIENIEVIGNLLPPLIAENGKILLALLSVLASISTARHTSHEYQNAARAVLEPCLVELKKIAANVPPHDFRAEFLDFFSDTARPSVALAFYRMKPPRNNVKLERHLDFPLNTKNNPITCYANAVLIHLLFQTLGVNFKLDVDHEGRANDLTDRVLNLIVLNIFKGTTQPPEKFVRPFVGRSQGWIGPIPHGPRPPHAHINKPNPVSQLMESSELLENTSKPNN